MERAAFPARFALARASRRLRALAAHPQFTHACDGDAVTLLDAVARARPGGARVGGGSLAVVVLSARIAHSVCMQHAPACCCRLLCPSRPAHTTHTIRTHYTHSKPTLYTHYTLHTHTTTADTLLLTAPFYREPLVLDKPLRLVGASGGGGGGSGGGSGSGGSGSGGGGTGGRATLYQQRAPVVVALDRALLQNVALQTEAPRERVSAAVMGAGCRLLRLERCRVLGPTGCAAQCGVGGCGSYPPVANRQAGGRDRRLTASPLLNLARRSVPPTNNSPLSENNPGFLTRASPSITQAARAAPQGRRRAPRAARLRGRRRVGGACRSARGLEIGKGGA